MTTRRRPQGPKRRGASARRQRRATPPLRKRPASAAPLTLAQARGRARARTKPLHLHRAVAASAPGDIGVARDRLALHYRAELAQRVRLYRETYRQLEQHGVAAPTGRPARARLPAATPAGRPPLRLLAQGNSWFDYPLLPRGGLVARLENRIDLPTLNLAQPGDEVRTMLGVEDRERLESILRDAVAAGAPFDALRFSGGGNDIVGNPMCLWIESWDPTKSAAQHLDARRFAAALGIVRAGYEDLIELRDLLSPATHLFLHAYDFAIPGGHTVCHPGPWLEPTSQYRRFPTLEDRRPVVREMLLRFAAMLATLAAAHPGLTMINAQRTLDRHPDWWHNELHPNGKGFDAFVEIFRDALRRVYPGRIPA